FHFDNRQVLQPFNTGPRNCIGRNLAHSETRISLALLLYSFDMELHPKIEDLDKKEDVVLVV
ncbi:hypothetical protein COCSADRAFT_78139, partial [Bipolaris sorokiniana ND90Pr]